MRPAFFSKPRGIFGITGIPSLWSEGPLELLELLSTRVSLEYVDMLSMAAVFSLMTLFSKWWVLVSNLTSVPGSRDAPRRETTQRFKPRKYLPRESAKIWSICHRSTAISPPEYLFATGTTTVLHILLTLWIAASAVSPCKITTSHKSSVFGTKL